VDGKGDGGTVVDVERSSDAVGTEKDDDVSLAEMLRANSEVLNRMCRDGDDRTLATTPEPTAKTTDLDERLPDLINDIDVLGESFVVATTAAVETPSCATNEPAGRSVQELLLRRPKDGDDDCIDFAAPPLKPFAPFPSKVRQPKRLGIELGLYPDASN